VLPSLSNVVTALANESKIFLLNLPNVVTTRASKGPGKAEKPLDLESFDLSSKLASRCHNQGQQGLRKVIILLKVCQTLSQPGPTRPRKG